MKTILGKTGLAVAAMCLSTPWALADVINYTLNSPNDTISAYPAPYGNVNVNLTSPTTAVITFTGATTGGFTYKFGGAQALDVNANSSSVAVSNLTGFTAPTNVSSGNVDGKGLFNVTIDNFDGAGAANTPMGFTLTNTGGTWASASSVLIANSAGFLAAAHIFVYDQSGANVATGFAGNGPTPPSVPDGGATMSLLGFSLLCLEALRRKIKLV